MNFEDCNTWHQHDHGYFCTCSRCTEKLVSKVAGKPASYNWRVSFLSRACINVRAVSIQILPVTQIIAFIDENNNSVLEIPLKLAPIIIQIRQKEL